MTVDVTLISEDNSIELDLKLLLIIYICISPFLYYDIEINNEEKCGHITLIYTEQKCSLENSIEFNFFQTNIA